jgi:type IV pilus assembly protein PilQ
MGRIRPIIEQLDRATDQVMIESKFVEVTNSDIKNLGVNWSSLNNYQIGAGNLQSSLTRNRGQTASDGVNGSNGTSGSTTTGSNSGTNTSSSATQNNGSNTSSTVSSTNGTPTQTSSAGTTGALTNTSSSGTNGGTTNTVSDTLTNTLNLVNSIANTGDTSRAATALFSASQFNLVLSALQTLSDVKIVSNPTIVTLNNNEATINIGESDPLPNYTFNPQTGTQEVSGFNYKDIGIILKVKPQVNGRGTILLTLNPEVSQKNGTLTFGAAQLPIIATRKASTVVSLKDGFTMGIGGLLSTQTTKAGSKVPLLGSIPGIGRLFRSDTTDRQGTNLIIFITAKTLSADGAPIEQVFDSDRVRELQMRREDLPGHRDGSDPFLPSSPEGKASAKKSIFPFMNSSEKK